MMKSKKQSRGQEKTGHSAGFSQGGLLVIVAMIAAIVLASLKIGVFNKSTVLGEETADLDRPTNVSVGNISCKSNWPWASISWSAVPGANAYRVNFWKTSGALLHSEMAESAGKTTEMYKEISTDISVQSLKREGERVIAESADSEKVRLTTASLKECGSNGVEDNENEDEEERTLIETPEPTKTPIVKAPTPRPTVEQQEEEVANEQQQETETESETNNQIEERVNQLEKENEELKIKQNSLEALVGSLLSALKNIFNF